MPLHVKVATDAPLTFTFENQCYNFGQFLCWFQFRLSALCGTINCLSTSLDTMAASFDPKKIKFEDYLHVEGVKAINPKLPAFKTDAVRTKNLELIKEYLVSLEQWRHRTTGRFMSIKHCLIFLSLIFQHVESLCMHALNIVGKHSLLLSTDLF